VALACAGPATAPAPTQPAAPLATISETRPLSGTAVNLSRESVASYYFAPYRPAPVSGRAAVPPYAVDLAQVANPAVLAQLNEAQQAALAEAGFVVVPGQPEANFAAVYAGLLADNQPVFITADALLYSLQLLFAQVQRQVEQEQLLPELLAFSRSMAGVSQAQLTAAQNNPLGTAVEEAAWRNLAFFTTAGRLLQPDFAIPDSVADIVAEELTLIGQAGGVFVSPLFQYQEDYRHYRPEGYYTGSEDLNRYFQATTWYGRMAFRLTGHNPDPVRLAARQALLIISALESGDNLARWQRLYEPTAYFHGFGQESTVYDYTAAARAVYGDTPGVLDLADSSRLDDFIATVQVFPRWRRSDLRPHETPAESGAHLPDALPEEQFRLLAARASLDDLILAPLVFNRVGVHQGAVSRPPLTDTAPMTAVTTAVGLVRGLPRPLDLAAVLGSEPALAHLTAAGDTDYEGYDRQMATWQNHIAALPEMVWWRHAAWGWRYSLQPLLQPPPAGAPRFMHSEGWQDRQLAAWYGGWLVDREIAAWPGWAPVAGDSAGPDAPANRGRWTGYVEPQPHLYARLAAFSRQLNEGLQSRDLLNKEWGEQLLRAERHLTRLTELAEKELAGEAWQKADDEAVGQVAEWLLAAAGGSVSMALLADIYLTPAGDQKMQAAVAEPWRIYVVVASAQEQLIATGAVFSVYEFRQPTSGAGNDAWHDSPTRPLWAPWSRRYVVP
jgi:hypothetical protein